jgi:hypothetical protein
MTTNQKNLKHSAGNWYIHGQLDDLVVEVVMNEGTDDEYYQKIANVRGYDYHSPNYERSEANAKLIAAAPDMLLALMEAVNNKECYNLSKGLEELFTAVISKAI